MTITSLHVIAWRDLDDPTSGGSEVHLTHLVREWARLGIDVTVRTGRVVGAPEVITRGGVRVIRRGGRLGVWIRNVAASVFRRDGRFDARLEVWHGVSFFSPLWSRIPTVGIYHHVHTDQFADVLPPGLSHAAMFLERRIYPRLYRGHRLIVLSDSVKQQMIDELSWPADDLVVVEPGVADDYVPGERSPVPTVVVVGRMMPQKQMDIAVDVLARVRAHHPDLRGVIIGDGPERAVIEARVDEHDARSWIDLPGAVDEDAKIEAYQQAWLVLSCSRKEGWGMTITEGAACGTPAVVTDISGHREAIIDGRTGVLATDRGELVDAVTALLDDDARRVEMGDRAREHAAQYRWETAARRILDEIERVASA
jgi:glycosyltransferase involved in cell wall biosynthesis